MSVLPGAPPDVEPDLPRTERRGPGGRGAGRGGARSRRDIRRRRWLVVLVLLLLAAPFLLAAGWFWYQVDPPGSPGARVSFEVRKGWGAEQIGDALSKRGVIGSALAFKVFSRLTGGGPFQAGTYVLRRDMGASDAVDALEHPPAQQYRTLALPPGLTIDMIAARVGQIPGLSRDKFLAAARSNQVRSKYQPAGVTSLEGLTWPDTYFVAKTEDEMSVLRTLVHTFDEQATKVGLDASPDPYHVITVASLIQTEAKLDVDRPLIAGVVENRLRDGMPLQIDATLLYARGSREGRITDADRNSSSPYNTYQVKGLPPTPISSVAAVSLRAALHPADVPYKFYVLIDASGKHAFAVTFAEHERNVAEARRKGLL